MHAAGVLSDAIYSNQTWEKYEMTFNPKVKGGWNLHQLTLNYPLEHFVMFSSITANLGTMGQSNHVSANLFLDSLASYRNSIGLPATTINWGQWGQESVAANLEVVGVKPFTVLEGISALEKIMRSQKGAASVSKIDFAIGKQIFPGLSKYLEDVNPTEYNQETSLDNEKFWSKYDATSDEKSRTDQIKALAKFVIRKLMKLDNKENLEDNQDFQNLGMDSLMIVGMKNALQSTFGNRAKITANSIRDCHNVNQLASKLIALTSGQSGKLSREELIQLMREDSILPANIKSTTETFCKPSEIKYILFTGATGNLGPYMLKDIFLKHPKLSKLYCLVRESKTETSKQRLENVLVEKGMIGLIPMDKIECINGSVTELKFGIGDKEYLKLSQEIDAVFHLAVKSNFVDGYRKYAHNDVTNMRAINVLGTLNVLEFVCSVKTKLMFHASSIVANGKQNADKSLSEDWSVHGEFDEVVDLGYPISKHICDLLMTQAVKRGIPIKVFRFPSIGGDSITGANANYENNQLMLRLMSYLHLGFMPKMNFPFNILPVDVCGDLSVKVFFKDDAPNEIYNIYNPYPHNETEFISIAKEMGYDVETLEVDDFIQKVRTKENSMLLHFIKETCDSGNQEFMDRFFQHPPAFIDAFVNNPKKAFFSENMSKVIQGYLKNIEDNLTIIKRELIKAKALGIFDKYRV